MKDVPEHTIDEFIASCRQAAAKGLMRCSSGNISQRLDKKRMLVTASRSWMENLSCENVSLCNIADGALLDGAKPTVEIAFHAGIMKIRDDVNVIMHFQTPFATTMACRNKEDINYFVIPEIPFYIGHIAHVPYLRPGSKELADAVILAMKDHDMAIMNNHGLITVATDHCHAFQNAEFFELACEIIIRGGDTPLAQKEAEHLLELRRNSAKGV